MCLLFQKEHVTSHNWLFWQRKKNWNRMCFRSYQYPRRHKKLPNGKRYHYEKEENALSISAAVDSLLTVCEQFGKNLILFGHTIQTFACPVLMHALQACNKVFEFTEVADGFVDTLKLFKLVKPGLSSYRQENLCEWWCFCFENPCAELFYIKWTRQPCHSKVLSDSSKCYSILLILVPN